MPIQRVANLNHHIFRQCREQMGLDLEEAQKKVRTIGQIEQGDIAPTFRQLKKLADLYHVPQWVFLRAKLPPKYNFQNLQSFRRFADSSPVFDDHKVRKITARVEQFRNLIIELRSDLNEPVDDFIFPGDCNEDIASIAYKARQWLGTDGARARSFGEWKKAVEDQNVFVFLTSKQSNWSKADPSLFRGFSVYKSKLPIIVINDSDARAAQSFTLFHELGHLLRKESTMDADNITPRDQREAETWCNRFAGEVLMPENIFSQKVQGLEMTGQPEIDLEKIQSIANSFKVSAYACVVRLRQLTYINQRQYDQITAYLLEKYRRTRAEWKESEIRINRDIAREKLRQYGRIYAKTVVQAYHDREIGLHKLCKLLDIKKATYALEMESLL